jgi:hypothetical protein
VVILIEKLINLKKYLVEFQFHEKIKNLQIKPLRNVSKAQVRLKIRLKKPLNFKPKNNIFNFENLKKEE